MGNAYFLWTFWICCTVQSILLLINNVEGHDSDENKFFDNGYNEKNNGVLEIEKHDLNLWAQLIPTTTEDTINRKHQDNPEQVIVQTNHINIGIQDKHKKRKRGTTQLKIIQNISNSSKHHGNDGSSNVYDSPLNISTSHKLSSPNLPHRYEDVNNKKQRQLLSNEEFLQKFSETYKRKNIDQHNTPSHEDGNLNTKKEELSDDDLIKKFYLQYLENNEDQPESFARQHIHEDTVTTTPIPLTSRSYKKSDYVKELLTDEELVLQFAQSYLQGNTYQQESSTNHETHKSIGTTTPNSFKFSHILETNSHDSNLTDEELVLQFSQTYLLQGNTYQPESSTKQETHESVDVIAPNIASFSHNLNTNDNARNLTDEELVLQFTQTYLQGSAHQLQQQQQPTKQESHGGIDTNTPNIPSFYQNPESSMFDNGMNLTDEQLVLQFSQTYLQGNTYQSESSTTEETHGSVDVITPPSFSLNPNTNDNGMNLTDEELVLQFTQTYLQGSAYKQESPTKQESHGSIDTKTPNIPSFNQIPESSMFDNGQNLTDDELVLQFSQTYLQGNTFQPESSTKQKTHESVNVITPPSLSLNPNTNDNARNLTDEELVLQFTQTYLQGSAYQPEPPIKRESHGSIDTKIPKIPSFNQISELSPKHETHEDNTTQKHVVDYSENSYFDNYYKEKWKNLIINEEKQEKEKRDGENSKRIMGYVPDDETNNGKDYTDWYFEQKWSKYLENENKNIEDTMGKSHIPITIINGNEEHLTDEELVKQFSEGFLKKNPLVKKGSGETVKLFPSLTQKPVIDLDNYYESKWKSYAINGEQQENEKNKIITINVPDETAHDGKDYTDWYFEQKWSKYMENEQNNLKDYIGKWWTDYSKTPKNYVTLHKFKNQHITSTVPSTKLILPQKQKSKHNKNIQTMSNHRKTCLELTESVKDLVYFHGEELDALKLKLEFC